MKNQKEELPVRDIEAPEKEKQKKRRTVRGKIVTFILCVLAAFALWMYVMQTESPSYTDTVTGITVQLENTDELTEKTGLSVYSGQGTAVNVAVSGKKSLIARLSEEEITATVDVSRVTSAGRHSLPVSVELPSGLILNGTVPETITVYVDGTVSKSVPVKEKYAHLELPAEYKLGQIQLGFDTVTVEGPAGKVKGVSEAQVVIDMDGKTSSFTAKHPITLLDATGAAVSFDYLKCSATETDVTVPILKTVDIPIPAEFKHGFLNEENARVTLSPSALTVSGDERDVSAEGLVSPILIDEKALTSNTYSFKITPSISPKVTLESGTGEVTVTVEVDSTYITREFAVSEINVVGASRSIKCEVEDENVVVVLRGTKDEIMKIKDEDLSLSVDMTGYDAGSSGTVTRPATVVIDGDAVGVWEIGTYTVQVKIS